jgi:dihydrofolate reductase/thymidylate synthase
MHTDYTNEGVDQLADIINQIKNNPQSRRIVMTAWNPSAIKEMALPPCHILA